MQGCQRVVEDWQRIIQVHTLVVSPYEDMYIWLKYASLCRKSGRLVSEGNVIEYTILPECKMTVIYHNILKIKYLLRNSNLPLISYSWYTKRFRFYLLLPISFAVSFFTISAFIFLTLTPNIPILLTAVQKHVIISLINCIGYMALLTTLHNYFWWDALPCSCYPHWLNNTFIFLGL